MTLQILKSQIAGIDFEAEVEAFIQAKIAHTKVANEPAPTPPHPVIESAVKRVHVPGSPDNFVADYVIVDDTPPLDVRKEQLISRIRSAEQRAKNAVISPANLKIMQIKAGRASKTPEEDRTDDERATIKRLKTIGEEWEAISLSYAEIEAEAEQVTEETISDPRWDQY